MVAASELIGMFGWVQNLVGILLGIAILGVLVFLAWWVKKNILEYKYTVIVEEMRVGTATPRVTRGKFVQSKEGKIILILQNNPKKNIGTVTYDQVYKGDIIRLLRVNEDTYVPLGFKLENEAPVHTLVEDEQMRFAYASAIEKIWSLTNREDILTKYGNIIWLIVAAVLLIVVMWPVLDATTKASDAFRGAASSLENVAQQMVNLAGAQGGSNSGVRPPVQMVIAPSWRG